MRPLAVRLVSACAAVAFLASFGSWATLNGRGYGVASELHALIAVLVAASALGARSRRRRWVAWPCLGLLAVSALGLYSAPGAALNAGGAGGTATVASGGILVLAAATVMYAAIWLPAGRVVAGRERLAPLR